MARTLGTRTLEAGEARVATIARTYPTDLDDLWRLHERRAARAVRARGRRHRLGPRAAGAGVASGEDDSAQRAAADSAIAFHTAAPARP